MIKSAAKFFVAFVGIVGIGIAVLLVVKTLRSEHEPQPPYVRISQDEDAPRSYDASDQDPFGGFTGEQTLRLFIQALKEGDTELAAKYFLRDEQPGWREDLALMKEKKLLPFLIHDLENVQQRSADASRVVFGGSVAESPTILVGKNSVGRWKIIEL